MGTRFVGLDVHAETAPEADQPSQIGAMCEGMFGDVYGTVQSWRLGFKSGALHATTKLPDVAEG